MSWEQLGGGVPGKGKSTTLNSRVCSENTVLHGKSIRATRDGRTASQAALAVENLPANEGD